jgi:hypothetical protein
VARAGRARGSWAISTRVLILGAPTGRRLALGQATPLRQDDPAPPPANYTLLAELEGGTTATFDGTTGCYLSTGLNFSSAWTALSFAAFALIPGGTTQVCGFVGNGNPAANGGAYLQLLDSGGSLALQFNVGTASATFVSSASWADGNWHHVVASWDGSTAIGYLDGVQIGSSGTALTATVTAGSADVTVGAATGPTWR